MQKEGKKQQVIKVLQQAQTPITLPFILKRLGANFAERSTRRWLNELVMSHQVIKTGQKRSTHYQIANEITTTATHAFFSLHSKNCIANMKRPIFERRPVPYHKAWLDKYQPNKTFYLSKEQRSALHTQGEHGTLDPAGTFARKIYQRLLIDLSYNSSRLEGNTYSLIETEKLIVEGIASTGKLDEEKVMILNHKEAIRHLVDHIQKIQMTPSEICTLHYLLSDGLVLPKYAGKIRDHGIRISASTYMPLEHTAQLSFQLDKICQKASYIKDPFEQSFFLLTHLAYLQAFTDVNKRTSRLSANIPLIAKNLVPLSFNSIEKEDYASAMIAIYELNDTAALSDLYTFSYLRSCQEYNALSETMNFDETRVRFREERRHLIREVILQKLKGVALKKYINAEIDKLIPKAHQTAFKKNVLEDLEEISPVRIAGMGITTQQLQQWLIAKNKASGIGGIKK